MHTLVCMENMVTIVFLTWMRTRRTQCTSCVIGLDPGHANILAIARTDRDTRIPTTYVLPNKHWRVLNGNQKNMQRIHSRSNYMQRRGGTYDNMINRLQSATSKVTSPTRMKCTYTKCIACVCMQTTYVHGLKR